MFLELSGTGYVLCVVLHFVPKFISRFSEIHLSSQGPEVYAQVSIEKNVL